MRRVVLAYTVDDTAEEVAYFAWLPEGQYWSNLGLDLVVRNETICKYVRCDVICSSISLSPSRCLPK